MKQNISPKMKEFISKVQTLCWEYCIEIHSHPEGWNGKTDENGEFLNRIYLIGEDEAVRLNMLDGDGI